MGTTWTIVDNLIFQLIYDSDVFHIQILVALSQIEITLKAVLDVVKEK